MLEKKLATKIMAIINLTPDSFWSGSRAASKNKAVKKALIAIEEGADILDLGAESSRPGAMYVSEKEEIERLIPVIRALRKKTSIPISVDTRRSSVFEAAFSEGASMLNDISALEDDVAMAPLLAKTKLPVVLMHKRGEPKNMQNNTQYADVFNEVFLYLQKRVQYALDAGIKAENIIVDPGIGFGKDVESNMLLVKKAKDFACILPDKKLQVLIGFSRKASLGILTGRPVKERLAASIAVHLLAVQSGANILRVHDVKETIDMLRVLRGFDGSI